MLQSVQKTCPSSSLNMGSKKDGARPCTQETEVHRVLPSPAWISMHSPSTPQLAKGILCRQEGERQGQEEVTDLMAA